MSTRVPEPHSFVVKIWTEEVRNPGQDAAWRGSITHVKSGERRYLESLPQIVAFIAPYVRQMDAPLDWTTRLLTWWMTGRPIGEASSLDAPPGGTLDSDARS